MGFWHDLTAKSGGLFGGPRRTQPQLQSYEQMSLLRWRANMGNQHVWHCRIGRVTIKALK